MVTLQLRRARTHLECGTTTPRLCGKVQYSVGPYNGHGVIEGSTITDTNKWHYLAVTTDGSTIKTYFDGKLDGITDDNTYEAGDDTTWIGAGDLGPNNYPAHALI